MREISLKLLNLNLGIKLDNSKDVIELIKEEQCDIVAFQEVMRKKMIRFMIYMIVVML